ncbi:lytic transglycosylase domain-containing protein [Wukongibacter sp. M2B1]|uniref:lytic transglycosylase domain-containing protein n=1 Tax=Wukongibacter sp. M2B1 TaxID=3088895 RepID=UPI003D7BC7CD
MTKRLVNVIILIILIINTAYISYAQYSIKADSKVYTSKTENLKKEFSVLSVEIDERIKNLEQLVEELEEKKKTLDELKSVQKYMNMDLDQVQEIAEKTPLDLETAAIVSAYSKKFNIKSSLILAIIKLESDFNQYEVGEDNDRGYMQIIPSTEKWLAREYGHKLGLKYDPQKIFEPEYNIGLGVVYLSILKEAYGENYERILSEYNRGPYNLKRYYQKHKTYSTTYSRGVLTREKKFLELND